jgi:hypothetical protein
VKPPEISARITLATMVPPPTIRAIVPAGPIARDRRAVPDEGIPVSSGGRAAWVLEIMALLLGVDSGVGRAR